MSLLTRYILTRTLLPAVAACGVICFLLLTNTIQEEIEELLKKAPVLQFSIRDVLLIAWYALPTLVAHVIPIALLMGILFGLTRMVERNEIVAVTVSGVSRRRLVVPIIAISLALSILSFGIQNALQPVAHGRMMEMLRSELPSRMALDAVPPGVVHEYGDWRFYTGKKDSDGTLRDIIAVVPDEDGGETIYYADRGWVERRGTTGRLVMEDVHLIPTKQQGRTPYISTERTVVETPTLDLSGSAAARQSLTLPRLFDAEQKLSNDYERSGSPAIGDELRKYRIELAERFSIPFMCLAMGFVAAPLGIRRPGSGRSAAVIQGALVLALYFMLRKLFEPQHIPSMSTAFINSQAPNLALALLGGALIVRLNRV